MHILDGDHWSSGFLDYHRLPGEYRLVVCKYITLKKLDELYFRPRYNLGLVFNYVREIGFSSVVRKIWSRRKEKLRNEKFLAFGIGYISESEDSLPLPVKEPVLFIAPNHPQCLERIALPQALVRALRDFNLDYLLPRECELVEYGNVFHAQRDLSQWQSIAGWSPYSGKSLPSDDIENLFAEVARFFKEDRIIIEKRLPRPETKVQETCQKQIILKKREKYQAVVFGYGHYAKTNLIPNLDRRIKVVTVHEIESLQLGNAKKLPFTTDSSPIPRKNERYDVYCVAGYHHTHAPLAVHALNQGASAIVEKPLATTWLQLQELLQAMKRTNGNLFACFHKRYSRLNDYIFRDMQIEKGEPVAYHCIVYEVKLPALHWYRWPNSRSRIVSNGCHWIDHFLFLNGYSPAKFFDAWQMNNEEVICVAELENGASFSMVLTDHGSARLGVQEIVELRAKDTTIQIHNNSKYLAENSKRILRKTRVNKIVAYTEMYKRISTAIIDDQAGDSIESVKHSTELMLKLENVLCRKAGIDEP